MGASPPTGTLPIVVRRERLRAAARFAANDAKVREVIQNAGSPILYLDSPDFEKYVQADVRRMSDVVRKIGKVE